MSFTIDDFQDLEQILEENPEWRVRLRRQILSDELIALPEQVSSLAKQIAGLAEAQQRTEGRIGSLTEQVEALTHVVGGLKSDVADLKGIGLENQYWTRGHAYFGRLLHRAHVLSSDEIISLLEDAAKSGMLSAIQVDEILLADIIVSGKRREDGSAGNVERMARKSISLLKSHGGLEFMMWSGQPTGQSSYHKSVPQLCQLLQASGLRQMHSNLRSWKRHGSSPMDAL